MGTMQIESLDVVLLKNQAVRGTAETDLDDGDVAEVEVGAKLTVEPRVKDIDLVGSPQNQSIIGPHECGISLTYPMRTGGAASNGQIGSALLSCLLALDTETFTPTYKDSEWVDSTIWAYSGSQDTSLSLLYKIQNVMFGAKIALDFSSSYAALQLEGKGVLVAAPALATQPVITPSTVVVPSLMESTVSLFGDVDFIPVSMEFDLGPDIAVTLKPSVASGLGITVPSSKRKIKWSAKVYHDSGVTPHTQLLAGTLGTISVAWGTAPNRFVITSTSKAQITKVDKSEQDGVTCFDLSGIIVDNSISIQLDTSA